MLGLEAFGDRVIKNWHENGKELARHWGVLVIFCEKFEHFVVA